MNYRIGSRVRVVEYLGLSRVEWVGTVVRSWPGRVVVFDGHNNMEVRPVDIAAVLEY